MIEIWKDIPGYEGYAQASSYGRVRSLSRITNIGRKIVGRILSPCSPVDGYYRIRIVNIHDEQKLMLTHRLIALAFIENPHNKPQVNHKDGNKLNNDSYNLEWVTNKENSKHAWENKLIGKTHCWHEKHNKAKLNWNQVNQIREMYKSKKYTHKSIAHIFNVSRPTISAVINYKNWNYKYINDNPENQTIH